MNKFDKDWIKTAWCEACRKNTVFSGKINAMKCESCGRNGGNIKRLQKKETSRSLQRPRVSKDYAFEERD